MSDALGNVPMMENTTNDWASPIETPDPSPLPRLPGWHILVRPLSAPQKTRGGILVPDSVAADHDFLITVGRVLVVGDLAYGADEFKGRTWTKPGDIVVWGRHVGRKIRYQGIKLVVLEDKNILLVTDSPANLFENWKV